MQQISACMIVKDEADILEETLDSIKEACDEIIIVDTGSTDNTKEIAKKYTDRVYDFEWVDDFSAARNTAYSYATKDYIFFMDADDYLPKEERKKLLQLKENLDDSVDAVTIFTVLSVDEFGNPAFKYRRHRLSKRSNNFKWHGTVHEYLAISGTILHSDIAVYHRVPNKKKRTDKKHRNLKIYENQLQNGEVFSPRDMFYYANELKDHAEFEKAIKRYNQFLDSKKGWIEDNIRACIYLADCYMCLGNHQREVESLTRSFVYDTPRPEVSCRLGDMYKIINMYDKAILWYRLAIEVDVSDSLGFQLEQYSTWYPHLQSCVCYWQIGNKELAYKHHLKAKEYRQHDKRIQYNEQFFTNTGNE
ncbi:glycosyltransferase involved in cell wall biosynthesis [Virgibacillus natechei]|uniref:Glycosyltransferase involved in cell wall biosynthesis n=1 Tax=Virgibacillus natechei TaxID=1216297 RepID=A0ABS4IH59_9BACI|nr:glycosyltransferase family 2 protein [Virgibacillus natechei]MBP1969339.1 glycosyltransferase involved in cell wall biosynthesis [Virgibacillus natechei]UZD12488.1 glycosyltransferase family 2 protein [Virgibacillus natechei]